MNTQQDRYLQLLDEFGRRVGDDLAPSEHGVTSLIASEVEISLEHPDRSDFIYFHATVRRLGSDAADDLAAAMQKNLFGLPVSGSWLAHDAETNELILCYSARVEKTTADDLVATIDAMAVAVKELQADRGRSDLYPVEQRDGEDLAALSFSVFRV